MSLDIVELIYDKREAIKTIFEQYGASAVRVFGSSARDDYSESSDVDLLVKFPKALVGFKYFDVLDSLEQDLKNLLGVDVDVIDERSLKGASKEKILKEAVAL